MATINQTPGTYNLAFGIQPVTLSGILSGQDKYVLQVRNRLGTVTFADVRQSPNASGRALFDIQAILQNLLNPSPIGIETFNSWVTGANETREYRLYYGTESGGLATIDGFVSGFKVLSGRKAPADLTWASGSTYRYTLDQVGLCTGLFNRGKLLTDWDYPQPANSTGLTLPSRISGSDLVIAQKLRPTDAYSISFIQEPIKDGIVTANNIVGAWVTSYDSTGAELDNAFIYNTTALGGGPATTNGQNLPVVDPYWTLTLPCGPVSSEVANVIAPLGPVAYYWVTLHTLSDPSCSGASLVWNTTTSQWELEPVIWNSSTPPVVPGIMTDPVFTPLLIEVFPGECNDFEPIQLSWENSFGFRDYWTFAKRHDRSIDIARNDYMQNPINYNAVQVSMNPGGRGTRTFGQTLTDKYTVRTDWLTDEQAQYLENLFISPDVRANLGDGFVSVTLLTSSYVEKTVRKDQLFQYELQFKTAYNINSQRG